MQLCKVSEGHLTRFVVHSEMVLVEAPVGFFLVGFSDQGVNDVHLQRLPIHKPLVGLVHVLAASVISEKSKPRNNCNIKRLLPL